MEKVNLAEKFELFQVNRIRPWCSAARFFEGH